MDLFPAIDLIGGACVRLKQGAFDAATLYEPDPLKQAQRFAAEGASWLHIVDLDGAKDGAARQTDLIARLARETPLRLQAGGGVRTAEDVQRLLDAGVRRVVVGSLAVQAPETVFSWLSRFGGERIVLALDIRANAAGEPEILTRGWQDRSGLDLMALLHRYAPEGLKTLLCTDVARDGMMTGPNVALYKSIKAACPALALLASGGVGALGDLRALDAAGADGAIVGKALYEKKFTLSEALQEAAHAG